MKSWKQLFALGVLGVALSSVAQVNVRPDVAKSLQGAQEALQAKQPEIALKKIQEIRTSFQLTEPEALLMERMSVVAALNAQQYPAAARSLDFLLQSSAVSTTDRLPLMETMVGVSVRLKDHAKVVQWARQFIEQGGDRARVQLPLVQTLAQMDRYSEVLQEMFAQQKLDQTTGRKPLEAELRAYAFSQKKLKDDAGYLKTLQELVRLYPTQDYWADLLNTLGRKPGLSARQQLDISRLMEETQTLEDADDYTDMAQFALKAGLPSEALRILEKAQAQGAFAQPAQLAAANKLKQQAQQRALEDDKSLAAMAGKTNDSATLAQLADVAASKAQWAQAVDLYQQALQKGGLRREPEVRLHSGVALLRNAQPDLARVMFSSVKEDPLTEALAGLWLLRSGQ